MAISAQKRTYLAAMRDVATKLTAVITTAGDLYTIYIDRGYRSDLADPITDEEAAEFQPELTAAIVAMGTVMCQQLPQFMNGTTVAPGAVYRVLNNTLRSDR